MPNVPELKSKIISIIQRNGPSIPVHISKQINENMIFTGAVLSELISNKKLMISTAKIGGSPVYYLPGQEYKLSQVLYSYLKDVYKKVHDLLRKNVILRDKELEPWQRVALRELKDFAVMLTLHDGDIFWKWYLTSDQEAESLIKKYLGIEEKKEDVQEEKIKEKPLDSFEKKIVPGLKATEHDLEKVDETVERITGIKSEVKKEQFRKKERPVVARVAEKPEEAKTKEKQQLLSQPYMEKLIGFLDQKNITISEKKLMDKKEISLVGDMSSDIGSIKLFIKFKDKKKISDSDLITAHNESKTLPLYFVSTGDLTKKAQKYIENNFLVFEKFK